MKYMQKIATLGLSLAMAALLAVSVFADITPHESEEAPNYDEEDSWYEEEPSSEDESYWEESVSEESYDEESIDESSEESGLEGDTSAESSAPESTGTLGDTGDNALSSSAPTGDVQVSGTDGGSGTEASENYVVFGTIGKKSNEISDLLTTLGIVLLVLGVVGLGCIIAWSMATRNAKKSPDEEAYAAVGMADARNRKNSVDYNDDQRVQRRAPPPPVQRPAQQQPQRPVQQRAPRQPGQAQNPQQRAPQQARPLSKRAAAFDTEEILREALRPKNPDE